MATRPTTQRPTTVLADGPKADDHGNLEVHAGDAHGDAGVHPVKSGGYPADDTKADDHGNLIVHAGDAKADAGVHAKSRKTGEVVKR